MKSAVPSWIEKLAGFLLEMPRAQKRAMMVAADVVFIPLALLSAIILRFGEGWRPIGVQPWPYVIIILSALPIFARLGLYRAVIRYLGPRALITVVKGVGISVLAIAIINETLSAVRLPRSVLIIYAAFALLYVSGSRFLIRGIANYRSMGGTQRVAIYGAGAAGVELAMGLRRSGRYNPVAFIDDNAALHGSTVASIEVFSPCMLEGLVRDENITTVLLALPSQTRRRRQEILKQLEVLNVLVQTVPDIGDIVAGQATIEDLRDVDANDLLGRDPVPPNVALMDACIRNKVVMVSGAGGSIGSELCRQILRLKPSRIVLFEISEIALYNIDKELRHLVEHLNVTVEIIALLGNAHHRQRIQEIMITYGVQTVYHAAAYKHVPIVEHNVVEGIHNNVFSTWYSAEAAIEARVETFVLISTDKAVNPTNVMGATKRLAEIVLQGLQRRGSTTRFCMVRFGNVLESSGSVVPLFREQIRRGGPVTVTHKDIIRYFMTIPEAAQLVIQAGSMGTGGDVFVLDMGKPVKIEDLAKRMIHLMGLSVRDEQNTEGDIEIVYTGLRPAEKLYEELLIGNDVTGTDHPRIMRATEHSLAWPAVAGILESMLDAISRADCQAARALLMQAVNEYLPQQDIQDLVWVRNRQLTQAEKKKVTDISTHRIKHVN